MLKFGIPSSRCPAQSRGLRGWTLDWVTLPQQSFPADPEAQIPISKAHKHPIPSLGSGQQSSVLSSWKQQTQPRGPHSHAPSHLFPNELRIPRCLVEQRQRKKLSRTELPLHISSSFGLAETRWIKHPPARWGLEKCYQLRGAGWGLRSWDTREGPQLYAVLLGAQLAEGLQRMLWTQSLHDVVMRWSSLGQLWAYPDTAPGTSRTLKVRGCRGQGQLLSSSSLHRGFRCMGWIPALPHLSG